MTGLFKPVMDCRPTAYCGPSAIAILTGVPLSRIEKMLRRCRKGWGRKAVKGTYTWEVLKVLRRLGCKVEKLNSQHVETTIGRLVDDVRHAGTHLAVVTGHYMVACNGIVADNGFPEGTPIELYGRAQRHVVGAYKVTAPALPHYTVDDALMASKPAAPKKDIKAVRAAKVAADVKRWERKEKLAKTKLKKLRAKLRYYERLVTP